MTSEDSDKTPSEEPRSDRKTELGQTSPEQAGGASPEREATEESDPGQPKPIEETGGHADREEGAAVEPDETSSFIVALQTLGIIIRALEFYKKALSRYARLRFGERLDKPTLTHLKLLRASDAFIALSLVLKESRFADEIALARAGMKRSFIDRDLTRNALGMALLASDGVDLASFATDQGGRDARDQAKNKYAQRAKRIVEAAIAFGLIEPDKSMDNGRENYKPLRASARLYELLKDVGVAVADDLHDTHESAPGFGDEEDGLGGDDAGDETGKDDGDDTSTPGS